MTLFEAVLTYLAPVACVVIWSTIFVSCYFTSCIDCTSVGLTLPALWSTVWFFHHVTSYGSCKSKARLDGKTVLITGCTSGIGEATAMDLAKRGARIIMACRNVQKANFVRERIIQATGNENIVVKVLDVGLLSSVRRFAEEINATEPRLDILIHNAGSVLYEDITEEGFNTVWATNHFGPFLLTNLLIDLLKRTKKSRIIYVSSVMHLLGDVDLENPNPKRECSTNPRFYNSSKFASILIANELARRLKDSEVTVNCVHPGLVDTPIIQHCSLFLKLFAMLFRPLIKTKEQGAQTTIYLAVSDEVEGVTGKYFADCKEAAAAKKTNNLELAKKYWALCETIVELNPSDSLQSEL